jgi:hypothetical protein
MPVANVMLAVGDKIKNISLGAFALGLGVALFFFAVRTLRRRYAKVPIKNGDAWQIYRRESQPFHFWLWVICTFALALICLFAGIMGVRGKKMDGSRVYWRASGQ